MTHPTVLLSKKSLFESLFQIFQHNTSQLKKRLIGKTSCALQLMMHFEHNNTSNFTSFNGKQADFMLFICYTMIICLSIIIMYSYLCRHAISFYAGSLQSTWFSVDYTINGTSYDGGAVIVHLMNIGYSLGLYQMGILHACVMSSDGIVT